MAKHPLSGSERKPFRNAKAIGDEDPNQRVDVTVVLRRRAPEDFKSALGEIVQGKDAHVKREEFAQKFGADPSDIAAVKNFAQEYGLTVETEDAARRTVILSGTVAQMQKAFDVQLQRFEYDGGTYRGRTGTVQIPDELQGIVEAVLGLDDRPQARPHFRLKHPEGDVVRPQGGARPRAAGVSYSPIDIAKMYNFPSDTKGEGQCIGVIELGGGFNQPDLDTYFKSLSVSSPTVTAISVDRAQNKPTGTADGPDGEVMLDIEVAGAIANASRIAVYFAPNTDAGFLDAITTALHDTVNKPSVVSISWGGPESSWTQQAMKAYDQVFQSAASMGITVCCASGDNGSSDGAAGGGDHVDFPASSSFVLACGGTSINASNGSITSESTWNDGSDGGATGGGISTYFTLPTWQDKLEATKANSQTVPLQYRGVPDVAADADPETGYKVRVDGNDIVFGGTSAVAPLWAALIALINSKPERAAPVGFINPKLYGAPSAMHDVTVGNNGTFYASGGWDACTGLGSPDGSKVLAAV